MNIEVLTVFLGWSTAINIGIFALAVIMLSTNKDKLAAFHGKLFGVGKEDLFKAYFEYMGRYKMLIIFFNLVPYLVLRLAM